MSNRQERKARKNANREAREEAECKRRCDLFSEYLDAVDSGEEYDTIKARLIMLGKVRSLDELAMIYMEGRYA